jgi:hypothetical protein
MNSFVCKNPRKFGTRKAKKGNGGNNPCIEAYLNLIVRSLTPTMEEESGMIEQKMSMTRLRSPT